MIIEKFEIDASLGKLRGQVSSPVQGARGYFVCLHGSPNGDFHGNADIFDDLSEVLGRLQFATVQFSFCGSAPSDGVAADVCIRTQLADYDAVLDFLTQTSRLPVHVIGESAGATIASLYWKRDSLSHMLLWPAFDLADSDLSVYLTDRWLAEAAQKGAIRDGDITLGAEILAELQTIDFAPSFILPDQPIFIAHGQSDKDVPHAQSLRAIGSAKNDLMFYSPAGAGHGFQGGTHRRKLLSAIEQWIGLLG